MNLIELHAEVAREIGYNEAEIAERTKYAIAGYSKVEGQPQTDLYAEIPADVLDRLRAYIKVGMVAHFAWSRTEQMKN